MRIGMVCPYSLSVPGGVQGQVLGLARAMRERGHLVQVLGPCDGPPPEPGITVLGSTIQNPSNGSMAPIAPDPRAQLRTIRALWDERFDVVHVHEPLVPGPAVTAVLMKSAPLVGTFHAAGDASDYEALAGFARRFASRLDVKVAVSTEALALARTAIPDPWVVLFNGVSAQEFATAVPWSEAGAKDVPAIFFLGRHEERKGLGVLLEAVARLDRDLVVWIAGDGPLTESLRQQFAGDRRLRWLGRISDDERNRRMAGATVFCAPSLGGESFGVILVEAMAAGAPVVASDLVGYAAVAGPLDGNDAAGILVPPGDADAFSHAIESVLASSETRHRLRRAGRIRAESFSMERLAEAYEEIYATVLRQPSSPIDPAPWP
jgi:phosphatidylinositol alpha-mannosyltransferase